MYINKDKSIITLSSWLPWKTTTLLAGVHGNEVSWVQALHSFLEQWIPIVSGKVFLIFANIEGLSMGKRYYEKDMNRCFITNTWGSTYEEQRVREILPYLEQSDYVLDIHNTLSPSSFKPFLISEHYEIDNYFDVEYVVSGFDALHPGGSDGYMNSMGKIGLCLEVGSIYDNADALVQKAKGGILNFLKYTGNIAGIPIQYPNKKRILFDTIYRNRFPSFRLVSPLGDFESVKAWQLLGYDGTIPVYADREGTILFARNRESVGEECFCLGNQLNLAIAR